MRRVREIIQQFFRRDYSEDVQKSFSKWLLRRESQEAKDEALAQLWEDIKVAPDASTERSYQEVRQKIRGKEARRPNMARMLRIAAMYILPVIATAAASHWWHAGRASGEDTLLVELYVPYGETRQITLPDNSSVHLNSGATLIYPQQFKGRIRSLYLSGEAKFTVASGKDRPFIVKTKDMDVRATGTVFNVSSYPDSRNAIATLVEGTIEVNVKSEGSTYNLNQQSQIVYDRETHNVRRREIHTDIILEWEKGLLAFRSASLHNIIKEMERHFDVRIFLNSTHLGNETLTVKFAEEESLADVLHTLRQLVPGLEYKMENKTVYIY
ncbi:MAG: FecR domain-containing protein [Tannerellaceae bacterium]|jgi:ferric-dicitrate binding protein FerR (iron transport regulator)|nr:FecR domain-containing protein [Tannerellaceae bacterium]